MEANAKCVQETMAYAQRVGETAAKQVNKELKIMINEMAPALPIIRVVSKQQVRFDTGDLAASGPSGSGEQHEACQRQS